MVEYTSGWAYFYKRKENIGKNINSTNDLILINHLAFKEMSSRNEDLLMADSKGHSLNRKIKIRFVPFVREQLYVLIGKDLFYIYQIDTDLAKMETFIYMESLRSFIDD